MEWHELFGSEKQPSLEDMEKYIGGEGKTLWRELFAYMEKSCGAKPKMSYSTCSGKPGWNVKFQKSGKSFGTLYPEKGTFSVFTVIGYNLEDKMDAVRLELSDKAREMYDSAGDFMKIGRYMMFQIACRDDLNDYIALTSVKMKPKSI